MAGNNLSVQKTFKPQVFNSGKLSKGLTRFAQVAIIPTFLALSTKAKPVEARNPRVQEPTGVEQQSRIDKTLTPPKLAQLNLTGLSIGVKIRIGNTTVKIEKIFRVEDNNIFYKAGSNYYLLRGDRFIPAKYHDSGRENSYFEVPDYNQEIRFSIVEEPRRVEQPTLRKVTPNAKNLYNHITVGTTILGLYTPNGNEVYQYLVTDKGTSTDGKYTVLTINHINPNSEELGHDEYIAVNKRTGQIFKDEIGNGNYNRTLAENWNRNGFLLNP